LSIGQEITVTQKKTSPLRARMIEDTHTFGMVERSQKAQMRTLKDFTAFLGRWPDAA
jgi:integrase/recombinase XerD